MRTPGPSNKLPTTFLEVLLDIGDLLGPETGSAEIAPRMPYTDTGTVEDKQGKLCKVRWDETTGIVQARVYIFPIRGEPHWDWHLWV